MVVRWNKRHPETPAYGPDKGRIRYAHPPNRSPTLGPGWAGPWGDKSRNCETSYQLWTGSREVAAHASMTKDSYDPGFGAPVAALSYVGFWKRAKIDDTQGLPEFEAD